MLYRYLVVSGEEEGEEFEFDDLSLYIFRGSLWVSCPRAYRDVEAKELYELYNTEEGEEVIIEFDDYFLEGCRDMRALEEFDHPMGIYEFSTYIGEELTPEEYRDRYSEDIEGQLHKDLTDLWLEHGEDSLNSFEIEIITGRLAEYLHKLTD